VVFGEASMPVFPETNRKRQGRITLELSGCKGICQTKLGGNLLIA